MKNYKIAVAGTGYVGLSLSVLLAQHNQVMAVDIVQAKVDMIITLKNCFPSATTQTPTEWKPGSRMALPSPTGCPTASEHPQPATLQWG